MPDQQDNGDQDVLSDIEIAWSDNEASLIIVTTGGEEGEQVYVDASEARAIGQALIRAADEQRREPGPFPIVWKSARFTSRHVKPGDPWAQEGEKDA